MKFRKCTQASQHLETISGTFLLRCKSQRAIAMSSLSERISALEKEIFRCRAERAKTNTSIADQYFLTKEIGRLVLQLCALLAERDKEALAVRQQSEIEPGFMRIVSFPTLLSELISSFFCAPALEQEPPPVQRKVNSLRVVDTESLPSPVLAVAPQRTVENKQDVYPRVRQRSVRPRNEK